MVGAERKSGSQKRVAFFYYAKPSSFLKFLDVERKDICAAETIKSEEHGVTRLLAALPLPSSTPRFALSLSHFGSLLVLCLLANTEIHLHLVTGSLLYAR